MAINLTNTNLTQISIKRLSGKAHTSTRLSIPEESLGSFIQNTTDTIFADSFPFEPSSASAALYEIQSSSLGAAGSVMYVEFDLTIVPNTKYSNNASPSSSKTLADIAVFDKNLGDPSAFGNTDTFHAYALTLSGGFEDSVTNVQSFDLASTPKSLGDAPFKDSFMSTGSSQFQIVPEFVTTLNVNNPYVATVIDKQGTSLQGTDGIDYYLDTAAGILFVQDPRDVYTANAAQVPDKLRAFIYTGKYQSDLTFSSGDVGLHFSASEGTGFSLANDATASFESGSAGITVTAGSTNTITIGESTDNVFFNDISASGDLYVSKSIFIDGGGGYNDATIEVVNDRLEIKDFGTIRIAMDSDGDTTGGSAKKIEFGTGSAGAADFQSLMVITSSGDVGIGEGSPAAKLHVDGNISSSGNGEFLGALTASNLLIYNTASITYFETTYQSSSIIFSSGSTKFGDTMDDTHVFTGSLFVTGNLTLEDGTIEANRFIASASTGDAGFIFRPSDNDLTANSIKITSVENMQFKAGGVFQFNQNAQLLRGKKLQLNDTDNTSRFSISNVSTNTGSNQNNTRLGIENMGGTEIVSISGSGFVGIGTTTPNKQLTIQDGEAQITGSNTKRLYIEASGQGGSVEAGLRLATFRTSAGNVGSSTLFKTGSSTILSLDEDITIRNNQKTAFVINGAGDINFVSASDSTNDESTTLTSYLFGDNENRRIGIGGITSPSYTLDVTGSARIRGPFSQLRLINDANSANMEIGMSAGDEFYLKRGDTTGKIRFRRSDNNDPVVIDMANQRVGINKLADGSLASDPLATLHISSSDSNALRIETEASANQQGPQLFILGNKADGAPARTTIIELKGDDIARARGIEFTVDEETQPENVNKKWYAGTIYNTNGYTIGYTDTGINPEYPASSSFFVDDDNDRKIGIGTTTPRAKLGIEFEQMANPEWFDTNPRLAWGFYGHRLNLYRSTEPHNGFKIILERFKKDKIPVFIFTSNVDGHFQKTGFAEEQIMECHGSL
ncbi:MAG: hypothetical protein CL961_01830, partial [Euryarchaeota archaeon]|nr:hypothetical protein [Euryarchaeota archaeon]